MSSLFKNDNYYKKYIKYKQKYLNQKNILNGGEKTQQFHMNFLNCDKTYTEACPKLAKVCTPDNFWLSSHHVDKSIACISSAIFNKKEIDSINNFMKYIMPYIKTNSDDVTPPNNIVKLSHALKYSIIVEINNLAIKIVNLRNYDISKILREVKIVRSVKSDFICEYYPYVTSNTLFASMIPNSKHISNNVFSDLPFEAKKNTLQLDLINFMENIVPFSLDENLLFFFVENGKLTAKSFFTKSKEKIRVIPDFVRHVATAIKDLHNSNVIHNNIKADNIVVVNYKFKLIDLSFNLSIPDEDSFISLEKPSGYPQFFSRTIFEKSRSLLYDWHCLYRTVLTLLNVIPDTIDITNISDFISLCESFGFDRYPFGNVLILLAHMEVFEKNIRDKKPTTVKLFTPKKDEYKEVVIDSISDCEKILSGIIFGPKEEIKIDYCTKCKDIDKQYADAATKYTIAAFNLKKITKDRKEICGKCENPKDDLIHTFEL